MPTLSGIVLKGEPVTIQARLRGAEWVADDIVAKN
jgi:hypothetical protein